MSRCNYIDVEAVGRMCAVHGGPAPCPSNGDPALPYPIHVFSEPDQIAAVEEACQITAGSRPIIVHHGNGADPGHLTSLGDADCWCQPVTIPSG